LETFLKIYYNLLSFTSHNHRNEINIYIFLLFCLKKYYQGGGEVDSEGGIEDNFVYMNNKLTAYPQ